MTTTPRRRLLVAYETPTSEEVDAAGDQAAADEQTWNQLVEQLWLLGLTIVSDLDPVYSTGVIDVYEVVA